jgi:hypothetical protein
MKTTNLDGKWETLIPQLTDESKDPAIDDLDKIVREYATRDDKKKAPVVLGSIRSGEQTPVGRIEEVRRKRDSLEGRFGGVDPRVDYLHGRGVFQKKSVRINRTPDRVSLEAVGLVQPKWVSGHLDDDQTPSIDDLMKQNTGTQEAIFADFSGGYIEIEFSAQGTMDHAALERYGKQHLAEKAIAQLKGRGRWCDRFERDHLSSVFAELAGGPAFPLLSQYIETLVDYDPGGTLLAECAKYYAREKGITFGEALEAIAPIRQSDSYYVAGPMDPQGGAGSSGVSAKQRAEEHRTSDLAVKNRALSPKIADLAWKLAESKGWPFKAALQKVSAERPDLVEEFRLENLRLASDPLGRSMLETKSTGDPTTDMARTVAAQKKISFSEALTDVAAEYGALLSL